MRYLLFTQMANVPDEPAVRSIGLAGQEEIWKLTKEPENDIVRARLVHVIEKLLNHPDVLFVGNTEDFDERLSMSLLGRGLNSYQIHDNQPDHFIDSELAGIGKRGAIDGVGRVIIIRQLFWRDGKVYTKHCHIHREDLQLDSLIRKYYIDSFLEEN